MFADVSVDIPELEMNPKADPCLVHWGGGERLWEEEESVEDLEEEEEFFNHCKNTEEVGRPHRTENIHRTEKHQHLRLTTSR